MAFVMNAAEQGMRKETSPITVKLNIELYEKARAISKLTGKKLRKIIEDGLEHEVLLCLNDDKLREAVDKMIEYRRGMK